MKQQIYYTYQSITTLAAMREKIALHFKKKNAGPIVTDNAVYSFLLLGIKIMESETYYLLVDPHCSGDNQLYEQEKMISWRPSSVMKDEKGRPCSSKTIEINNTMFLFTSFEDKPSLSSSSDCS